MPCPIIITGDACYQTNRSNSGLKATDAHLNIYLVKYLQSWQ